MNAFLEFFGIPQAAPMGGNFIPPAAPMGGNPAQALRAQALHAQALHAQALRAQALHAQVIANAQHAAAAAYQSAQARKSKQQATSKPSPNAIDDTVLNQPCKCATKCRYAGRSSGCLNK